MFIGGSVDVFIKHQSKQLYILKNSHIHHQEYRLDEHLNTNKHES